jgi:hypothetical protein
MEQSRDCDLALLVPAACLDQEYGQHARQTQGSKIDTEGPPHRPSIPIINATHRHEQVDRIFKKALVTKETFAKIISPM